MKLPPDTNMPPISDNARGVAGHVLCQIYALGQNGRKYKLGTPVPRITLETTNKAFSALNILAIKAGGLKRIWVEPVVPDEAR